MTKIRMTYGQNDDDGYKALDGSTLRREDGQTPSGNPINGMWVYRDNLGKFVDYGQWRVDLATRHNLELIGDLG